MNSLKTIIYLTAVYFISRSAADSAPKTAANNNGGPLTLSCSQGVISVKSAQLSIKLFSCKPVGDAGPLNGMAKEFRKICDGKQRCVLPTGSGRICHYAAVYVCRDVTPKCGGHISADVGIISNFGRDYGNLNVFGDKSTKCEWKVNIPSKEKTKIVFKTFHFPLMSCIDSIVTVTSKGKPIGVYCNGNSPVGKSIQLDSDEFQVQVNMNLKKWTPDTGFKLQYYPTSY